MRKIVITNEIKEEISKLLSIGKTPKKIAEILNISYPTVSSYLRNLGIKFRPSRGNENYFHSIDSYAKAYIVGFIAADGALVKTRTTTTLTITIKYEDKAVLEFIKTEIGNTHELQEIIRPSSFDKTKTIHHIRYTISSKIIEKDLNDLGITSNKSLSMGNILWHIPYKYRDAFIIGYFDGDGSVMCRDGLYPNDKGYMCKDYSLYIQIRGTRAFLKGICNHLNIAESHIHQNDSIPNLSFANKKDVIRFFNCYEHLPFYYKRKHDIFLKRINHISFAKYRQVQTISSSVM